MKLYELSGQYQDLERLAESEDIPEEVLRDTLEGLLGDFEVKATNIAKLVLSLDATAEAIEAAAEAMKLRAKRIEQRAEQLRAYVLFHMQAMKVAGVDNEEIVIKRKNNQPAVVVTDEAIVPDEYWRQPPPPAKVIDKKALKEAIQALEPGKFIPGAYVAAGERLEIKP